MLGANNILSSQCQLKTENNYNNAEIFHITYESRNKHIFCHMTFNSFPPLFLCYARNPIFPSVEAFYIDYATHPPLFFLVFKLFICHFLLSSANKTSHNRVISFPDLPNSNIDCRKSLLFFTRESICHIF